MIAAKALFVSPSIKIFSGLCSSIAVLFVSSYCVKMSGGFLRFQAQYLRRIRVPRWQSLTPARRAALIAAPPTDRDAIDRATFAAYDLTPAEARVHPRRNVITRALGSREALTVDVAEIPLASGDLVLLCSDGLTGELLDEEIRALIDDADTLEDALEKLIGAALWRGGRDNITAVLVRIP